MPLSNPSAVIMCKSHTEHIPEGFNVLLVHVAIRLESPPPSSRIWEDWVSRFQGCQRRFAQQHPVVPTPWLGS
eukprot:1292979-Karenia_brevis.AAC.1